jgi:hypothetical protein
VINGNVATYTLTIDNPDPGTFSLNASATVTMGGVTVTRATNGTQGPGGAGAATKVYEASTVLTYFGPTSGEFGENAALVAGLFTEAGGTLPAGTLVTFQLGPSQT